MEMKYQNRPSTNMATQKSRMMHKIREYDFAIYETALFLDTHPNNSKALKYYSKLRAERNTLVTEFQKEFSPITIYGNMNESKWNWIKGPWPWEGDC